MPKISELATGTVTSAGKIAVVQGSATIQASVADVITAGGGGVPVKGISTAGGGFGLPGELTGIRIELTGSGNQNQSSITIQYNDSSGAARAFKLTGSGLSGVTAGSAGDTSN
tara:strand:+ start:128 stop:466 length:339 start_codon:yes stop_codon:yes gene_type:complete